VHAAPASSAVPNPTYATPRPPPSAAEEDARVAAAEARAAAAMEAQVAAAAARASAAEERATRAEAAAEQLRRDMAALDVKVGGAPCGGLACACSPVDVPWPSDASSLPSAASLLRLHSYIGFIFSQGAKHTI